MVQAWYPGAKDAEEKDTLVSTRVWDDTSNGLQKIRLTHVTVVVVKGGQAISSTQKGAELQSAKLHPAKFPTQSAQPTKYGSNAPAHQ